MSSLNEIIMKRCDLLLLSAMFENYFTLAVLETQVLGYIFPLII